MDFPASRADRTKRAKAASGRIWFLLLLAFVVAVAAQAQMPESRAWELLESGQSEHSVSRCAAGAVTALGMLAGETRAAEMAVRALQDKDPRVRAAALLRLSSPSGTSIGGEYR